MSSLSCLVSSTIDFVGSNGDYLFGDLDWRQGHSSVITSEGLLVSEATVTDGGLSMTMVKCSPRLPES